MIYSHSHTWLRKIFVAFIALVIILTYIPQDAFAANGWRPGSKAYFRKCLLVIEQLQINNTSDELEY